MVSNEAVRVTEAINKTQQPTETIGCLLKKDLKNFILYSQLEPKKNDYVKNLITNLLLLMLGCFKINYSTNLSV